MATKRKVIVVVCDSLRRDLLGHSTPTLNRFKESATMFESHRAIFPSATRVTSASMATGCRPARHGLPGNTMGLDDGHGPLVYSVGEASFVERLRAATGRTLRCPTLAERVVSLGHAMLFSNVSPGAAYFHDPDGFGYVYHRAGSFGPGRRPLPDIEGLAIQSGIAGDRTMAMRFCQELRSGRAAPVSVLWQSEPDWTAHRFPLGSPEHLDAIRSADENVARVLDTLTDNVPQSEDILVIVCSDHGNESVRRQIDIQAELIRAGFKAAPTSRDIVAASQGTSSLLYFSKSAEIKVGQVEAYLAEQEWVGSTYVGPRLQELGLEHEGGLQIAIAMATDDRANPYGVKGYSDLAIGPDSKDQAGVGQHGGLGQNERYMPFLMIKGPGFPTGGVRTDATSPLDIAPTALRHLGLDDEGMDGRALQSSSTER